LVGNYEGNKPQGGTRLRWNDDIKINFDETGIEVWTGLFWLRIGTSGELL
jgi:hypothetical protein